MGSIFITNNQASKGQSCWPFAFYIPKAVPVRPCSLRATSLLRYLLRPSYEGQRKLPTSPQLRQGSDGQARLNFAKQNFGGQARLRGTSRTGKKGLVGDGIKSMIYKCNICKVCKSYRQTAHTVSRLGFQSKTRLD